MPAVTVPPSPNGLPIASTQSPTLTRVEFGEADERQRPGRRDLEHGDVGGDVAADHLGLIFGAVGEGDGDLLDHRVRPRRGDDVVVGDDIAVGGDDEAGAERAAALGHSAAVLVIIALVALRRLAAEAAEEFLEARRQLAPLHLDALPGRDVDHRRLKPLGEAGEAHRRSAGRDGGHRARLVLGGLGGDRIEGQGSGGAAEENGAGDCIDVTHVSVLPNFLRVRPKSPRPARRCGLHRHFVLCRRLGCAA